MNLPRPLSLSLKEATHTLHRQAERSDFVRRCLQGAVDERIWAMYLAALHPLYEALERGLEAQVGRSPFDTFLSYPLARADRIARDLQELTVLSLKEAPSDPMIARVRGLSRSRENGGAPHRLLGHAYARYFGDLMGGQALARRVGPALNGAGVSWLEFDLPAPSAVVVSELRQALDAATWTNGEKEDVLDEARIAFQHAIEVFSHIEACRGRPRSSANEARERNQTRFRPREQTQFESPEPEPHE